MNYRTPLTITIRTTYLQFFCELLGDPVSRVHERVAALRAVEESAVAGFAEEVSLGTLVYWRSVGRVHAHRTLQHRHQVRNALGVLQMRNSIVLTIQSYNIYVP